MNSSHVSSRIQIENLQNASHVAIDNESLHQEVGPTEYHGGELKNNILVEEGGGQFSRLIFLK
jgi:hypothetical protein